MTDNKNISWGDISKAVNEKFGIDDDVSTILLFIGIQELGQGFKKYDKQEKTDLMNMATCKVLSYFGFYIQNGFDHDKWPVWQRNKEIPKMGIKEQETLLKKGIVKYFEANNLL